jgi:hypothetical protein
VPAAVPAPRTVASPLFTRQRATIHGVLACAVLQLRSDAVSSQSASVWSSDAWWNDQQNDRRRASGIRLHPVRVRRVHPGASHDRGPGRSVASPGPRRASLAVFDRCLDVVVDAGSGQAPRRSTLIHGNTGLRWGRSTLPQRTQLYSNAQRVPSSVTVQCSSSIPPPALKEPGEELPKCFGAMDAVLGPLGSRK